jgi:excisionase family DNA binding protein
MGESSRELGKFPPNAKLMSWLNKGKQFMSSISGETNNRNPSLFPADLAGGDHRPVASESAHFTEKAASSNIAPHLLTALQVATMLGVSKRLIWRLAAAGFLPGRVKIGKLVRWRRDEIERWIVKGCPRSQRRS